MARRGTLRGSGRAGHQPGLPIHQDPRADRGERVVAIGALCDFTQEPTGGNPGLGISIFEHCVLGDCQKVHLDDRGFTHSPVLWTDGIAVGTLLSASPPPLESLTQDVLNCVLPDDLPDGSPPIEDHPWEDLARSALETGVQVTADELRGLEYFVEFTDRVREWVSELGGCGDVGDSSTRCAPRRAVHIAPRPRRPA